MISIYKLTCKTGKIYYGSTTTELKVRLSHHKTEKRKISCNSKGFIDPKIELLETCEKEQQKERESYYIRNFECVNKVIPDRKVDEWKKDNMDKLRIIANKSYHKRKEKINEQRKEKITCECGTITNKGHLARHKRTDKHKKLISGAPN
tara:strand:- start:16 stop:462 length:447 start_codon:yes stop_codon:yes gene_type:complete